MISLLRDYIREALERSTLGGGTVDLYTFVNKQGLGYKQPETLVIDPARMSTVERRRSRVPRSYFYPHSPQGALRDNPSIRDGALYHVEYPAERIYDTSGKRSQWANDYGFVDQDQMFNDIKKEFPAAYIHGEPFSAVIFFEPVTARLVDDETKKRLMGAEAA